MASIMRSLLHKSPSKIYQEHRRHKSEQKDCKNGKTQDESSTDALDSSARLSSASTLGRSSDASSPTKVPLAKETTVPIRPRRLSHKRSIRQFFMPSRRRSASEATIHIVHDNPIKTMDRLSAYLLPGATRQSPPAPNNSVSNSRPAFEDSRKAPAEEPKAKESATNSVEPPVLSPILSCGTSVITPSRNSSLRSLDRVRSLYDVLPNNGLLPISEQLEATFDEDSIASDGEDYCLTDNEWDLPISQHSRPSTDTAASSIANSLPKQNINISKNTRPSDFSSSTPSSSTSPPPPQQQPRSLHTAVDTPIPSTAAAATTKTPTTSEYNCLMDSFPEPGQPATPVTATEPQVHSDGENNGSCDSVCRSSKRGIEDIMTPKRPGTIEAIRRETTAYIDSPSRAPSAPKKSLFSPENPGISLNTVSGDDSKVSKNQDSMQVDEDDDDDAIIFNSNPGNLTPTDNNKPFTAMATDDNANAPIAENCDDPFAIPKPPSPVSSPPKTPVENQDVEPMEGVTPVQTNEPPATPPPQENGETEKAQSSPKEPVVNEVEMASPVESTTTTTTTPKPTDSPIKQEGNAESLSQDFDPNVLYAASIPLPETPPNKPSVAPPQNPSDFYIPTNWLMNPNTVAQKPRTQAAPAAESSPLSSHTKQVLSSPTNSATRSANNAGGATGSPANPSSTAGATLPSGGMSELIPMTPAPVSQKQATSSTDSQKQNNLLDTLKDEWVPPHKLPKYSEEDIQKIKSEYDGKLKERDESKEILIKALKEEFVATLREQQLKFEQEKEQIKTDLIRQLEESQGKVKELEEKHGSEAKELKEKVDRVESESKETIEKLEKDLEKERGAYTEVKAMLDDYVDTSSKFIEEKEREINGVSRELTKLTLDRQNLEETLNETAALLEQAIKERDDVKAELQEMQQQFQSTNEINQALGRDVQVAQERCDKIQHHAQETLNQANQEIDQLRAMQSKSTKDIALLRAQLGKAEAKLRSAENELNSTKIHNEELFSLCESLERELQR